MNIRPKIPMYLGGNTLDLDKWILENLKYYDWYSKLYPNAQILLGNPLKQRNDNWDKNRLSSSHYTTDDLRRSAYNNYLYTKDYDARLNDLIYWSEQLKGLDKLTDLQIVDLYNTLALSIREAREAPQTYNKTGYSGTNQTFRNMFYNRSMQGTNTPDYNIGYLENLDNIEGTSTWQRRMDRYENPFDKDTYEGQQNRTFFINIPGTNRLLKVYKKENGNLGLFPNSPNNPPSATLQEDLNKKPGGINPNEIKDKESLWSKLGAGLKNVAPDLLESVRLIGTLHNNNRIFEESKKAVIPNLQLSYHTYRQVVGDEATKLAYYRRAALGETKAAQPFTSDADRLVAYMNEAKRIGDELRAQGDLADNQEIRRTSDESNQHQWANIQRDTEVANSNITEINKARAAKHQLQALKYLADWTNIDLYLYGREAKLELKKAEEKALNRQLSMLDMLEDLLGNTTLSNLKSQRDVAWQNYYNETDKNKLEQLKKIFEEANKKYLLAYILYLRDAINKYKIYKSGSKITYKDNTDKYLYKTSRDIVEHFRKMSKMTDDSRIKTLPKPIKLSGHPRKTKKMLMGGIAPFYIYRPFISGGEASYSLSIDSSSSSKSSKDTAAKEKLDMIKNLFKEVQGLPVDVSRVYLDIQATLSKARAFGEDLTTDDIASMYLNAMNKISYLKYSLDSYNKAHAQAVANEALNETAVGSSGELVLLNRETGEIKRGTYTQWKESDGKLNPLTNSQLLELRAHSPNLAFDDDIFSIVNNGVGLSKISKEIKNLAATLGSLEQKLEGVSEVLGRKIKAGLLTLAGFDGTPDGFYKITQDTKDSSTNVKLALNYIYNMLPTNYKVIMKMHSGSEENSLKLILQYLTSLTNNFYKEDVAPLTGKASKEDESSLDKMKSNPLLSMQREIGGNPINYSIITRDSNTKMSVNGTAYPALPKVKTDMSIESMLSTSGIDQIVLSKQGITFGDLQINPENLKDIMYVNSGRNAIVTLPCKVVNGVKLVNLAVKDEYEKAEQRALNLAQKGTFEYLKVLGEELKKAHLDSLLDSNGLPNKNMFSEFLIVEAYTTDKINIDNKNSQYIEKVLNPTEDLEDRINLALSTDDKKSNYKIDVKDKWALFEFTYNDIYRGTIFIPINNNPAAAMLNDDVKVNQSQELEELYLISNKSNKYVKDNSF